MAIDFHINGNNQGFRQAADDTVRLMRKMGDEANNTKSEMSGMFGEIVKQTAAFAGLSLGAAGLKSFAANVVNVRKEMQGLHTSFSVLLGDQKMADSMFSQLKEFAITTPLMFKDLAQGAQTMLGFNIEAEKVIPILKAIGDISMGDAQRFQSLTLAFSQMSATGKLMGQDLLQMINAGFNPLSEISRKTGRSISQLKDEMSAGAISAEMVTEAFMSATAEGGKFYGMLAEQGETLKGKFNELQGAIDDMFNSLGEASEGVIGTAVEATTVLIKNYDKLGYILASLIAGYGTYKATMMAVAAIELISANNLKLATWYMKEYILQTKLATVAQNMFNAATKANPYILLASVLVTAIGLLWTFSKNADEAAGAEERMNRGIDKFNESQQRETERIKELIAAIQNKSLTEAQRILAYEELEKRSAAITGKYSMEQLAVADLTDAYRLLNEEQEKARIANLVEDTNLKVRVYNDLRKATKGSVASRETQAFLKSNDLAGMSRNEVVKILKEQIDEQKRQIREYQEAQSKKSVQKTTYREDARKAMNDWIAAKAEYDKLVRSQTATTKEVAEARAKMEAADKAYEAITGSKASDQRKEQGNNQGKETDRLQRIADLEEQIARQRERMAKDNELAIAQARIDGMALGSEKYLQQADLDFEKEMDRIGQQKLELLRSREENARKLWEENNKDEGATWSSSGAQKAFRDNGGGELTEEDRKYFDALKNAAINAHETATKAQNDIDAEAMDKYLSVYGSMQERREAITRDYQRRIAKAETEGDRMTLQKELEQALGELDIEALKTDINWEAIFGDLGMYTRKQLQSLRQQLEAFKKSDEYTKATVENKKVVDEALAQLSETIADKGGIFGNIADSLKELAVAESELATAKEELGKAADEKSKEAAKKKVNKAQGDVDKAEAKTKTAAENARDSIASLASTITQLGNASEMSLSDVGSVASQVASSFGEMGQKVGGWIGAIFALADMIARDGIKGLIQNVGKLVGQALGGLFGKDIDESQHYYEDQKKIHDNYIKLLNEVIDEQEELLKKQAGLDAIDTYNKTESYYRKIQQQRMDDVLNYTNAGGSSGFMGIGSSSSHGRQLYNKLGFNSLSSIVDRQNNPRYGNNVLTKEEAQILAYAQQYAEIFGLSSIFSIDDRMRELGNATIEQIRALKEARELWSLLPDEVIEFYNEILSIEDAVKELQNTLSESVTGTGFETLESNFASTLENMDSKASDFGDNLEGIFRKAIVNGLMKSKYDKLLQDWYGNAEDGTGFAGAIGKGVQNLTEAEIENLRKSYMDIVEQAQHEANLIRDTLGIKATDSSSSTSATVGASNSITEEQGAEISGRLTAIQIGQETQIAQGMQIIGLSSECNTILNSMLELDALRNGYLSDIYDFMVVMRNSVVAQLETLNQNTKNL